MSDAPSVSVCFPAFNEEGTVGGVLEEAHELLSRSPLRYEILACDDGSSDATGAVIDEVARRLPHLRALHNGSNRGIRATFERLYSEATMDLVFLNSVDRQWPTAVLFELLPLLASHDIVIAARKRKHYGPARALVSWTFNALPRLLFGVETWDAGAVKLMPRALIAQFPARSRSPFSEAERLVRAARAGYRIGALPIEVEPRRSGRARGVQPAALLEAARDVGQLWWELRREGSARRATSVPAPRGQRR